MVGKVVRFETDVQGALLPTAPLSDVDGGGDPLAAVDATERLRRAQASIQSDEAEAAKRREREQEKRREREKLRLLLLDLLQSQGLADLDLLRACDRDMGGVEGIQKKEWLRCLKRIFVPSKKQLEASVDAAVEAQLRDIGLAPAADEATEAAETAEAEQDTAGEEELIDAKQAAAAGLEKARRSLAAKQAAEAARKVAAAAAAERLEVATDRWDDIRPTALWGFEYCSGGKDVVSLTVIATWLHSGRVRDKARERRESEEREKVERKAKAEKRRNERAEAEAEALAQAKAKLKPKKAPKQSALVKALVSPRHLPTKPALMQEGELALELSRVRAERAYWQTRVAATKERVEVVRKARGRPKRREDALRDALGDAHPSAEDQEHVAGLETEVEGDARSRTGIDAGATRSRTHNVTDRPRITGESFRDQVRLPPIWTSPRRPLHLGGQLPHVPMTPHRGWRYFAIN